MNVKIVRSPIVWVGALAVTFMVLSLCGMVEDSFAQTPIADAGPDQIVASGATVTLNGSGSTPPSNDTSYRWSVPTGSAIMLSYISPNTPLSLIHI